MAELKNRQWLLAERPQGIIKESDFHWNETSVPTLKDGQVLVRNLAFSFDPTQRGWMSMDTYMPAIPLGQTMKAGTVGQVIESKRPGFAKGDLVQGLFGWEDYTVNGGEGLMGLQKLPRGTDPILALSLLGTTGTHGLLRDARGRCGEGGRDVRGLGRGGRNRIGVRDDRQDQRMPRSWYRGRTREMRLAVERSGLRRRD